MDSFGIWCHPCSDKAGIESYGNGDYPPIDLHVNLWDIRNRETTPFIDVGILIPDYHAYDSICLYIPFHLHESDLIDLSDLLADKSIADLVFNDYCATSKERNGISTLKRGANGEKTILYPFSFHSDTKPTIQYGGSGEKRWSVVTFCIAASAKNRKAFGDLMKLYLRFRISAQCIEKELFCDIKRRNQFLESGFEATRIADIKFNKKRNISRDAIESMEEDGGLPMLMSHIHFFLMEPANNGVDYCGSELVECRKLEDEWSEYLDANQKGTAVDLLAYHWKPRIRRDEVLTDYALMARVVRPETSWRIILVYIAVAIALNVLASILFECLRNIFPL